MVLLHQLAGDAVGRQRVRPVDLGEEAAFVLVPAHRNDQHFRDVEGLDLQTGFPVVT